MESIAPKKICNPPIRSTANAPNDGDRFIHAPFTYCVPISDKRPAAPHIANAALRILVGKDSDIITFKTVHEDDIEALYRHTSQTNATVRTIDVVLSIPWLEPTIHAANNNANPANAMDQVINFLRPIRSIKMEHIAAPGMQKKDDSSESK
mmetsp:Transcript_20614/g.29402  ORF Transcript_20614/g.29402 Transcript_20614/m.29402 type:complete len:151 (+) Transcript_20614:467-919(+)